MLMRIWAKISGRHLSLLRRRNGQPTLRNIEMLSTRPAERMSDADLTRLTDKWMRLQDQGVSLDMFLEHPDFYLKDKAA